MKRLIPILCAGIALGAGKHHEDYKQMREWRNPVDGMRFVWVPTGETRVETPVENGEGTRPETMTVPGFWMGRTEVTVAQFAKFVRGTGYVTEAERATNRWTWKNPGFKQSSNQPVVWLSSADALAYATWAGADLPNEVEWLRAARGVSSDRYPWGDEFDPEQAWHRGNAPSGPKSVGRKKPNAWGLHDMVGNAAEYCRNATCGTGHACYPVRGSSWTRCSNYLTRQGPQATDLIAQALEPKLTLCARKSGLEPYPCDDDRGFRCVKRP